MKKSTVEHLVASIGLLLLTCAFVLQLLVYAAGCITHNAYWRNPFSSVTSYPVPGWTPRAPAWTRTTPLGLPVYDPANQIKDADLDNAVQATFACLVGLAPLSAEEKRLAWCIETLDVPRDNIYSYRDLGIIVPLPQAQDPVRGWWVSTCTGVPLMPTTETTTGKPELESLPCRVGRRAVIQENHAIAVVPRLDHPGVLAAFRREVVRAVTSCSTPDAIPKLAACQ